MSPPIHCLPEGVFQFLRGFIYSDDYHYFVSSSKRLFGDVKRRTIYFHLTKKKSKEYLTDESFQSLLLSKVENGWNQISIYYDKKSSQQLEIPDDLPIHRIIFSSTVIPQQFLENDVELDPPTIPPIDHIVLFPSCFRYLKEFDFVSCCFFIRYSHWNFHLFCNLFKLSIRECSNDNLQPLQLIPDLTVRQCPNIQDFSMLGRQKRLVIHTCDGLKDVRSFRAIHHLELISCKNLEDVSPLYGIYDLTIQKCPNVKDISSLGGHHRLKLSYDYTADLVGYDILHRIPHVSLALCNITDASVLRFAQSVQLLGCNNITDVSALRRVRQIYIESYVELKGLSKLANVKDLSLIQKSNKEFVNDKVLLSLKNVNRLRVSLPLSVQSSLTGLSIFSKTIRHLTLSRNDKFSEFIHNKRVGEHLKHLTSLTLELLNGLRGVVGLGNIPTLRIVSCHGLESLKGLGRNHCVEVEDCKQLKDVSSLSTVPVVRIRSCFRIDSSCLSSVPRLKIFSSLM